MVPGPSRFYQLDPDASHQASKEKSALELGAGYR
jgi:hypothetical protein